MLVKLPSSGLKPRRRDVGGDGGALGLPSGELPVGGAVSGGDAEGSVDGEPGHELRVHVVCPVAADLPDAGVGFGPAFCDFVGEAAHRPPGFGVEVMSGVDEQPGGAEDPSVSVELVLGGGAVPDPDGLAVGVAWPALEGVLASPHSGRGG